MQEVNREALVAKASELFANGTVDRALGWKAGEFSYDVTPGVFTDADELSAAFVWNNFCGANLSKYLIAETGKTKSRVLVFLKPCDTYSFNQLLTEHRFSREKVYAVGVPCAGMADPQKLKEAFDGVAAVDFETDGAVVHTLYDGEQKVDFSTLLPDRCIH